MKTLFVLWQKLSARSASLVLGWAAVGLVAGVVSAMILFSRETPLFVSGAEIVLTRTPGEAADLSEHDWLKAQAAMLRSREHLEQAAARARMDKSRGISVQQCADLLEDAVVIEIADPNVSRRRTLGDREVPEGAVIPGTGYLSISMTGTDAAECAEVVNSIVEVRAQQLAKVSHRLMEEDPACQQWLALSRKAAALEKEVEKQREELRSGLDVASAQPFHVSSRRLSTEELLHLNPPLLLREKHAAFTAGTSALAEARKSLEALPVPSMRRFLEIIEPAKQAVTAAKPDWITYGWQRAIIGTCAGLLAGIFFAWRDRRRHPMEPAVLRPAVAVEF